MTNSNQTAPTRSKKNVGYDLTHVDVFTRRLTNEVRAKAAGSMYGLQLNADTITESLQHDISLICQLASQSVPLQLQLRAVPEVCWPLMRDVFRAERSGNGTTTVLELEPTSEQKSNANVAFPLGVPEKTYSVDASAVLVAEIESVGLGSGIPVTDAQVDAGGNFDVMSSTAVWNGDSCVVYHSAQLTNGQLSLIAGLNIQGHMSKLFGYDPSVMQTAVVGNGVYLLS